MTFRVQSRHELFQGMELIYVCVLIYGFPKIALNDSLLGMHSVECHGEQGYCSPEPRIGVDKSQREENTIIPF